MWKAASNRNQLEVITTCAGDVVARGVAVGRAEKDHEEELIYPSHHIGNLTAYIRGAQTFPISKGSLKILGASCLTVSKPHSGPIDIRPYRPEFVHLCSRA